MEQRINPLNQQSGRQSGARQQSVRQNTGGGQGGSGGQVSRTVGAGGSNYGVARSPAAIRVGDVLKGEITDLRNNEISITLEDNTVVRAKISDSSSYSIGQTGAFRLTEIAGNTLYLENIARSFTETELTLINKALDEAKLPATERNQEAVKALMDNLLPINRTSIQNLMQQAYDCRTSDMNTLAVMNRLMMAIDAETVEQFSNYRNDNYQLLGQLMSFAKDIPALLTTLAENGPADAVANFGRELLAVTLGSTGNEQAFPATIGVLAEEVQQEILHMLSGTALTEEVQQQLEGRSLSLQDAMTLLRDAAMEGTLKLPEGSTAADVADLLNQINQALEPASGEQTVLTEDFVKNTITFQEGGEQAAGEAVEETADALKNGDSAAENTKEDAVAGEKGAQEPAKGLGRFGQAGKFLQSLSENARSSITDTLQSFRQPASSPQQAVQAENPVLHALTDTYSRIARADDYLNSYLPPAERQELLKQLEHFPVSKSLLHRVASGEATTKEVLTAVYNTSSLSDSEQVQALFRSPAFAKLFARQLQSGWTITPEQFSEGKLSEFYTKMANQLDGFRNLIGSSLSGSDSEQMGQSARDMESNLAFMKTLSDTFSFFQLPMKLPSQDAHGDLYVYTQKERLRSHPEKASVLLHLDMEHLGQIDIRIDKNRMDIATDFSLNDQESVNLFKVNAEMLKSALSEQGYSCQMQFKQKEEPSPGVDDFINTKVNTHATAEMKRFSFDIRA